AGRRRGEVALAPRVGAGRTRHLQRGRELDRLGPVGLDVAFADLAVGYVIEGRRRRPRGAEREHVLVAGDAVGAEHVRGALRTGRRRAAPAAAADVIDDLAVGSPRRRVDAAAAGRGAN